MITLLIALLSTTTLHVQANCDYQAKASKDKIGTSAAATQIANPQGDVAKFQVTGDKKMMCGSCEKKIQSSLKATEGVFSVMINRKKNIVMVDFDKTKTTTEALTAAIQTAGYATKVLN